MEYGGKKKNPHAILLGRRGGKVKSEAKAAAARLNGLKGGYHKQKTTGQLRKKTGKAAEAALKAEAAKKPKRNLIVTNVLPVPPRPQRIIMEREPR